MLKLMKSLALHQSIGRLLSLVSFTLLLVKSFEYVCRLRWTHDCTFMEKSWLWSGIWA